MSIVAPESSSVVPATPVGVSPGMRLVPARVGRPGKVQSIYIECPSFCTQDHVDDWQYDIEDIEHTGARFSVEVPTMADGGDPLYEWYGRVSSDPWSSDARMRSAHVLVGDCSREDARLTPDMTDELADKVIAYGLQLRAAARVARQTSQAGTPAV
ncbi:hypothetical protein ABZ438_07910 [Streptomyces sp. NPDC005786]|uniref:DUF6907 domain-containing protein n=1 Tax=Streptomyces sp. NPDC005786 TaxID=3154891 RepID=UPI00340704ED